MPRVSEQEAWARDALFRNDRYLLEFIEALNLCPFAKACREGGKLHREFLPLDLPQVAPVVERIRAVEAMPAGEVDVALLILPKLKIDAREFERFVAEVRREHERGRKEPLTFFAVAFHPQMKQDLANADRAVGFLRRSPDPTIQLVSAAATDRARDAARDPKELSRIIAEAGLRAVLEAGPERLAALLAEIHRERRD
jgi:hypothetical protein